MVEFDPETTALILVDMQNDFLHAEGAYGRAGQASTAIAALPDRLVPVADCFRAAGGWIVATQFTLVPGRGGAPFISAHLQELRPFLGSGDFAPGAFGHQLIEALQPADLTVEKVAFSAFYQSRLDWVLRRAGVQTLIFGGIVTNGGVASSVRDAHVRDYQCVVLDDGCAAFSDESHETAIAALVGIAEVAGCQQVVAALKG